MQVLRERCPLRSKIRTPEFREAETVIVIGTPAEDEACSFKLPRAFSWL